MYFVADFSKGKISGDLSKELILKNGKVEEVLNVTLYESDDKGDFLRATHVKITPKF